MIKHRVLPYEGVLPYPAAHVLLGSEVVKTILGFTKAHAVGRAFMWALKADRERS